MADPLAERAPPLQPLRASSTHGPGLRPTSNGMSPLVEASDAEAPVAENPGPGDLPPNPADAADAHLPLSGSSAMPDLSSPNVPRLKARVHQRLSVAECEKIPLSALRFRPLRHEDYDEMIALHTEWFPVSYDEAFYKKSVSGELFTWVATYCRPGNSASSSSEAPSRPASGNSSDPSVAPGGSSPANEIEEEDLLGMLTMSTSCEHHGDDIQSILGADCTAICKHASVGADTSTPAGCLAYILTLGVVDGFRRRGLARELLRRMVEHVERNILQVQAVYLHVVTYNGAAIKLYESMNFCRIAQFSSFYLLHGKPYDSFLYACYVHGGRPPWMWRLRNFFGIGLNASWRDWVVSAWSSLWRWENGHAFPAKEDTRVNHEIP
mmetsp:Transcript_11865/g.32038  ORF Transcript_11865/g.32038 Transcript_11865/m.32038 type:complete len:381 (-) Transcript_11865:175-1317(-)